MLIYCSHEFEGNLRNRKKIGDKVKDLQLYDAENTYISPIHCFGFMYHDMSYDDRMRLCLDLLDVCDEMWVLSAPSKGVKLEMDYAKEHGIPIVIMDYERECEG